MGKGDRKTKKGKIWRGSFGNTRPHKTGSNAQPKPKPKKSTKSTKKG